MSRRLTGTFKILLTFALLKVRLLDESWNAASEIVYQTNGLNAASHSLVLTKLNESMICFD